MSEKYFVHDELNGDVEYFDSLQEAQDHCKQIIEESGCDGWPGELLDGGLRLGIVTHESAKTNERPVPVDEDGKKINSEWDYLCDVEMVELCKEVLK